MCYYKTDEFMQQSGRIDSQIGKNLRFESSVNSEGIETSPIRTSSAISFESSVNSEGIETRTLRRRLVSCLRAV